MQHPYNWFKSLQLHSRAFFNVYHLQELALSVRASLEFELNQTTFCTADPSLDDRDWVLEAQIKRPQTTVGS